MPVLRGQSDRRHRPPRTPASSRRQHKWLSPTTPSSERCLPVGVFRASSMQRSTSTSVDPVEGGSLNNYDYASSTKEDWEGPQDPWPERPAYNALCEGVPSL